MPMQRLRTYFCLPPGPLSGPVIRLLLQRAFGEYHWLRPTRYGFALLNGTLNPDHIDYDALVAFYEAHQSLMVTTGAEEDHLFLLTTKPGTPPYAGRLIWATTVSDATPHLHALHARQVLELMRLTGALLVQAGLSEDFGRKSRRIVPLEQGEGQEEVPTVRDPSEGLAGLYWRNFFGPPFVRMFGARLLSLPPGTHPELGDGRVLVQPYEFPTQALTPEGDAAEQRLITVLGPECFYDHEQHRKPTHLPELLPIAP